MLEEKLIQKGISKTQLLDFAQLPKHNAKEDIFRIMITRNNWREFDKSERGFFLKCVLEVLAEIGLKELYKEFSPENEKNKGRFNYLGESEYKLYVGQMIAGRMLDTLRNPKYQQYDNSLTLNKIYSDTIKRLNEEN